MRWMISPGGLMSRLGEIDEWWVGLLCFVFCDGGGFVFWRWGLRSWTSYSTRIRVGVAWIGVMV